MKKEYDFSKATRGKFFRAGARLRLPIYLEQDVQSQLEKIARRKHQPINLTANQLIRKEIELIEQFA
jgi:hypothetical protein